MLKQMGKWKKVVFEEGEILCISVEKGFYSNFFIGKFIGFKQNLFRTKKIVLKPCDADWRFSIRLSEIKNIEVLKG